MDEEQIEYDEFCEIINSQKTTKHEDDDAISDAFSLIDTVSLGVLATQQTVLAKVCKELNISYDNNEAHSAAYDAEVTAQVFCKIVNDYDSFSKS